MRIMPVNNLSTQNFKSHKGEYENPINRKTEKNLPILQSVGLGVLIGGTAGGISTCVLPIEKASKRYWTSGAIGAAVAVATVLLTLPTKIYNAKVNAFAREKEMDIFSRDRELKSNLYENVHDEVKDEDIPLDQKLNHYAQLQMANSGQGLMLKSI